MKSDISPQKRLLNFQQFTPAKVEVGTDINGWLQTNKKSQKKANKKQSKRNGIYSNNIINKPFNNLHDLIKMSPTNIQQLKKKVKGFNSTNSLKKRSLSNTNASTVAGSNFQLTPISIQSHTDSIRQRASNLIKVSAFDDCLKDIIGNKQYCEYPPIATLQRTVLQIKQMPQQNIPSLMPVSKMEERSKKMNKILSYNRMKNTKNVQYESSAHNTPGGLRKNLVNQSIQILRGNLTANQHKALNMIVRKTQNIAIRLPKDKKGNFFMNV